MIPSVNLGVTVVTFVYPKIPIIGIDQAKAILCVKLGRSLIAQKVTVIKLMVVIFYNKAFF